MRFTEITSVLQKVDIHKIRILQTIKTKSKNNNGKTLNRKQSFSLMNYSWLTQHKAHYCSVNIRFIY